jgi:hypothetical protein
MYLFQRLKARFPAAKGYFGIHASLKDHLQQYLFEQVLGQSRHVHPPGDRSDGV